MEAIAKPVGLYKAGKSGAGGQMEPLTKIRKDIFQLTNMIYGLAMTGAYQKLDPHSIIIDAEYDGYVMHDPHSSRPMSFVTDDPAQNRGTWYGTFKAPNAGDKYSSVGKHKVRISAAPRKAPRTEMHMTIVVPKEGGMKTVQTTTTVMVPTYGQDPCSGKPIITGYKEEVTVTSVDVPAETEITYEGYSVTQVLGERDFSPEAGGVTEEYEFEIFWKDAAGNILPPYDLPQD